MVPKIMISLPTAEMARQAVFYDYLRALRTPSDAQVFMLASHGQSPARNRNIAIHQALMQDCTHLLFIDDDLKLPFDLLLKLLEHDKDMVGGHYLMRNYPHQPIAFSRENELGHCQHFYPAAGQTGLVEVTSTGLGCILIKTDVFRAMQEDCEPVTISSESKEVMCYDWIRLGELTRDHWCDDIGFYRRARAKGFKLFIDLDIEVGHMVTMTVWPKYEDGVHHIVYDSDGRGAVKMPQAGQNAETN